MKMTDEESVLTRMGVDFSAPAPGCCGMAGSFGFEADKYDVSIAIGELELMPAVREASPETLIIADGFSCREQIAQGSHRNALHLAQVIQLAIHGTEEAYPERPRVEARKREVEMSMRRAGLTLAASAIGVAALWAFLRHDSPSEFELMT